MKLSKYLVFVLCLIAMQLHAQRLNIVNYGADQGMKSPAVLSAYQDDEHLMWFGTNGAGAAVFDGREFKYIVADSGLVHNVVYAIHKVGDKMFFGTNGGLSVLSDGKFTNYTTSHGLYHDRIFSILQDGDQLLLCTAGGINVWDGSVIKPWTKAPELEGVAIYSVFKSMDGTYFVCSLMEGLWIIDPAGIVVHHKFGKGAVQNFFSDVVELSKNEFLLSNKTRLFHYKKSRSNLEDKSAFKIIESPILHADFYDLLQTRSGDIWLASDKAAFKLVNGKLIAYGENNGFLKTKLMNMTEDVEGNIWFCSLEGGVSMLKNEFIEHFFETEGLPNTKINAITIMEDGELWVGTENGLAKMDGERFSEVGYKGIADSILGREVLEIIETHTGKWIGTTYGIYHLGPEGQTSYTDLDPAYSAFRGFRKIWDLHEDRSGQMWLATQLGIARLENGIIMPFRPTAEVMDIDWFVHGILERDDGLWFATESGLFMVSGEDFVRFHAPDGFTDDRVRAVIQGPKDAMWLATNDGIYRYGEGNFKQFGANIGLSDPIYSLAFDQKGDLWAGGMSGIHRLKFDHDSLIWVDSYGKDEGFLGERSEPNAIVVDSVGHVWVGTERALIRVKPENERSNLIPPKTKIRNVRLFFNEITWSEYELEVEVGKLPEYLSLPFDKNHLTFDYIGVSHTTPDQVAYKYMVEGLDKGWLYSEDIEAVYENIPPGEYAFVLYAHNGEGVWSEEPVVFEFEIMPPFYQTWWFYSLCIAIGVAGIYSYITIRRSNVKIRAYNTQILEQKDIIEVKNQDIMDSIAYAQRIQAAILPQKAAIDEVLKDYFVMFKPRDIVSGDFYWAHVVNENEIFICAADCTGHGVPGAFMSMIGNSLLNEMIIENQMDDVGKILDNLRKGIISALKQTGKEGESKDGMDLALLRIDFWDYQVEYAGANNPLYHFRDGELTEYKADKQPIGYYATDNPFTTHKIKLKEGDCLYVLSDGFPDQFGGPKGKKFMTGRLKKLLATYQDMPMTEQHQELDKIITAWMAETDEEQVDDICFIGVRI